MLQPSFSPGSFEEEEEPSFVVRPAPHERRPAERSSHERRLHAPRRHTRPEVVVTGTSEGVNVPSSLLADELEARLPRASPALERRRLRRERRKQAFRRAVLRVAGIAMLLFIGQSIVAVLSAPQFAIARVEIAGQRETDAKKLDALANKLVGQNIVRADVAAIERAAIALPTVKTAHVERVMEWPPHAKLVLTERVPVLRVGAGQKWWIVDEDGVPYRRATAQDFRLYQLTSPLLKPQTGKPLPARDWRPARALALALRGDNARAISSNAASAGGVQLTAASSQNANSGATKPFWSLRRIYLDRQGRAALRISGRSATSPALRSHDELLVRLGHDGWAGKLERARASLAYFERTGRRASELDLTSFKFPVWTPQKSTSDDETT